MGVHTPVYRDIPPKLRELIEPVATSHGLELVDVDTHLGHGRGVVRITVDNPSGDGRVSIERCAALSRELSTVFDGEAAIEGSYLLEVSSPGLDRHLGRERDFAACCGEEVRLETRQPVHGRRRFRGRLIRFEGETATLEVDGQVIPIPFAEIKKASTVYQFKREDFAAAGAGRLPLADAPSHAADERLERA